MTWAGIGNAAVGKAAVKAAIDVLTPKNTKPAFNGNSQDFVAQKSNTDSISIFVNSNQN